MNEKTRIDIESIQNIVDGTLCRAPSHAPVSSGLPLAPAVSAEHFIYCNFWDESDREAFWRGLIERLEEYGADALAIIEWLKNATGLGDNEGDFEEAWREFGKSLKALYELAWKISIVAGFPPFALHPKRDEYKRELIELGFSISKKFIDEYKKTYDQGGIPQCTGRLFADILVLIIEALATKGAGKIIRATKLAKLKRIIPRKVRNSLASSELDETVEKAFREMDGGNNSGDVYETTQRLARGNLGERLATEALAADGHTILSYKPSILGTNQGGIDIVTMRNGIVHLIDNKALTRSGNVSSVSALTKNFQKNLRAVRQGLSESLARQGVSASERNLFKQAIDAIDDNKIARVVTNANVAPDNKILSGVTQKLQSQGIQFLNVVP